jgi:hypothetical protein
MGASCRHRDLLILLCVHARRQAGEEGEQGFVVLSQIVQPVLQIVD